MSDSPVELQKHLVNDIPLLLATSEQTIRSIKTMDLYDGDVIVAGYPKSGCVWLETIVEALYTDDLEEFCRAGSKHGRMPIEIDIQMKKIMEIDRPTYFCTHLPYSFLPEQIQTKNVKILNISRNPKDTVVSYYHFARMNKMLGNYQGSFSSFLDLFLNGEVWLGSWFQYMEDWMQHKNDPNICFIKYEDLIADACGNIQRIAKFLNKPLEVSKAEKIVNITSFDSMKKNPALNVKSPYFDETVSPFMRSGTCGNWKKLFTVAQSEKFDAIYRKFQQKTGIEYVFEV